MFFGGPWHERSTGYYGDEPYPTMHAPGGAYRYADVGEHGVLIYRFDSSLVRQPVNAQ